MLRARRGCSDAGNNFAVERREAVTVCLDCGKDAPSDERMQVGKFADLHNLTSAVSCLAGGWRRKKEHPTVAVGGRKKVIKCLLSQIRQAL